MSRRIVGNKARNKQIEAALANRSSARRGIQVESLNKMIADGPQKQALLKKAEEMKRTTRATREEIRQTRVARYRKKKLDQAKDEPPPRIIRPTLEYRTSLLEKVTRLNLPAGSFNAGLTNLPGTDKYVCVYRPDEYAFTGIILDHNLQIEKKSHFKMGITNCADPRLIWTPEQKLLMIYSSTEEVGIRLECIRGAVIMDLNHSANFILPKPFRVSPESGVRQKNWMPFLCDGRIYLIASVFPHVVYELKELGKPAEQRFEHEWLMPWFYKEFLRGNTNAVQLDDGNFLGTFHTAVRLGKCHYYDNGCYVFEGRPPFRVLRCAKRSYLPAESATEPHFRKEGIIQVNFPVGMVREGNRLLISYGDNDSAVKIMETTVEAMLETTLEIY